MNLDFSEIKNSKNLLAFSAGIDSTALFFLLLNSNISFVKAATKGTLIAEAKETSINPKIATYTVNITDEEGDLVAIFMGMVYRKKFTLDFSEA